MQHINKMAREKHGPSDLGFASPRWGWRREPQAVELLQTSTKMAARSFFPNIDIGREWCFQNIAKGEGNVFGSDLFLDNLLHILDTISTIS